MSGGCGDERERARCAAGGVTRGRGRERGSRRFVGFGAAFFEAKGGDEAAERKQTSEEEAWRCRRAGDLVATMGRWGRSLPRSIWDREVGADEGEWGEWVVARVAPGGVGGYGEWGSGGGLGRPAAGPWPAGPKPKGPGCFLPFVFCLFCFVFFYLFPFSVLFYFRAFLHFLKTSFLHNNYLRNIRH